MDLLKRGVIASGRLLLPQQEAEGHAYEKGARDNYPLGCSEEGPNEELERGLFEVLKDEDEAEYRADRYKDELGIFPETL